MSLVPVAVRHTGNWPAGGPVRSLTLTCRTLRLKHALQLVKALREIERSEQPTVVLTVHTFGGDAFAAWHVVDAIRASPVHVVTVATGAVYSAGLLIFAAGDERYASPFARFLLHDVRGKFGGDLTTAELAVEDRNMQVLNRNMWRFLARRSGQPKDFFAQQRRTHNTDWFVSARRACQWGLVTQLGVPRVRLVVETSLTVTLDSEDE